MECGNLRFPTEATHAGSAGADVPGHARRARRRGRGGSLELRQLPQLFVRHGVDQPETEERSGDALRTHRRPGRDDLARERLDPPVLDQRAAELEHRVERAVEDPPKARLLPAGGAAHRLVVAGRAGGVVEDGTQSRIDRLHFLELVLASDESVRFCGRKVGERLPARRRSRQRGW